MSKFAHDPVPVGRNNLDQHTDATWSVSFKNSLFVLLAFELARTAQDRPLDILVRHVFVLRRKNGRSKPRIRIRIASANARSNGDFSDDTRENAAALGVR